MTQLSKEFEKSESLEQVLTKINSSIESIELYGRREPEHPVLLIFGCPRSGSTLFMQWLAGLGCFGYPSNLIARFYSNPAFGCEVQKALVDYDKGNQIGLADQTREFKSSLGHTEGALAPSEFWYFWRRYFRFNDEQKLCDTELESVDANSLIRDLAAMEKSLGRPLVMKGMLLNWHIEYLAKISPEFFFTHIQRDLFYVAQSVLESRERYSGNREGWWSFKPPGYHDWLALSPIEQVAAQVVYTEQAVIEGMNKLPAERKINIEYSEFCMNPGAVYDDLAEKYSKLGCEIQVDRKKWHAFENREEIRLSSGDESALRRALEKFNAQVIG
jgi:hypothetical protein